MSCLHGNDPGLQAVILVGGAGSRLRPAVPDLPKVLAPVAGKPFLTHLLERLRSQGLQRVLLLVGYRAEEIATCYGDGSHLGLEIGYSTEDAPRGTGGALWAAAGHLSSTFLLLNGDTSVSVNVEQLARYHQRRGGLITLVGCRFAGRPSQDTGYVVTGRGGRALSYGRGHAPARVCAGQDVWACSGWQVCDRQLLERVSLPPPGTVDGQFSFESGFLAPLLESAFIYPVTTPFWDIGTPDRYQQLKQEWESQ